MMTPPSIRRLLAAALAVPLVIAAPAGAHPHVWIDTVTTFEVAAGKVTALKFEWRFDEAYSAEMVHDFHKRGGPTFDPAEIAQMKQKAFVHLKDQNYFTLVRVGGKKLTNLTATDFAPRLEPGGILVYAFTLPLPQPVDPARTPIGITWFEETFYIDMGPAEDQPARFAGDGSLNCQGKLVDDPDIKLYFGSVTPKMLTLDCPGGPK